MTTIGTPRNIHSTKPICAPYVSDMKLARSAFGGVPMSVPRPPIPAYAMPSRRATPKVRACPPPAASLLLRFKADGGCRHRQHHHERR